MATTIYITPSAGDINHQQCRVYEFLGYISASAGDHYRQNPELWSEVGLVNHHGELVHFSGSDAHRKELVDCQPLIGGLVFKFDVRNILPVMPVKN